MRLAAEQNYQPGQVFAELSLGQTARQEGRLDAAEAHIRNVLRTSERISSEPDVARTVSWSELGFIAEQRGDQDAARSWHIRSLTAARQLGDPQAVAQALIGLAGAQALGGQPARAARLLGAADAALRTAGTGPPPGDGADLARITAVTRQALGDATFAAEYARGRRLRPQQVSSLLPRGCHGGSRGRSGSGSGDLA
jgi:hypothetical protein